MRGSLIRLVIMAAPVAAAWCSPALARPIIWDRGPNDNLEAYQSKVTTSPVFEALSADDFITPNPNTTGADLSVGVVSGWMFSSGTPNLLGRTLTIYADDGTGHPGVVVGVQSAGVDTSAPSPLFPGFNLETLRSTGPSIVVHASTRYWLSWHGTTAGNYYFATGGNGVVQGLEAQFRSAAGGFPNWISVSTLGGGAPSDLAFRVNATQIALAPGCFAQASGAPDNSALVNSIQQLEGSPLSSRAADDVVPPFGTGRPYKVRRITLWMSTNTLPNLAFCEVFADGPGNEPGALLTTLINPVTVNLGTDPPADIRYQFTFDCNLDFNAGTRYWIAMVGKGTGVVNERARRLTGGFGTPIGLPAKFRGIAAGFPNWTDVSNPAILGFPTDLAFKVEGFQSRKAGDANGDEAVNFADVTTILAAFGANYLPCTGPGDANNDGVVNFSDITGALASFGS